MDPVIYIGGPAALAIISTLAVLLMRAGRSQGNENTTQVTVGQGPADTGRHELPWPTKDVCSEKHRALDQLQTERQNETMRRMSQLDDQLTRIEGRLGGVEQRITVLDARLDAAITAALKKMDEATERLGAALMRQ